VVDVQEVEDVRRDGGERTIAEVEDAGRLVRQDKAGTGEAVDGPGRDTADNERQ
jgi:hypothetical protein